MERRHKSKLSLEAGSDDKIPLLTSAQRDARIRNPSLAATYERTMRETAASRRPSLLSRGILLCLIAILVYYAARLQYHTRKATGRWDDYDWATGLLAGQDNNMEGFEQWIEDDGSYRPEYGP